MKNAIIITMTFATLLTSGLMSGTAAASSAAACKPFLLNASGESAGAVAKFRKRRAERRAKHQWENHVAHQYGKKFADIDDAKHFRVVFNMNQRGNTVATVYGQPCTG